MMPWPWPLTCASHFNCLRTCILNGIYLGHSRVCDSSGSMHQRQASS